MFAEVHIYTTRIQDLREEIYNLRDSKDELDVLIEQERAAIAPLGLTTNSAIEFYEGRREVKLRFIEITREEIKQEERRLLAAGKPIH